MSTTVTFVVSGEGLQKQWTPTANNLAEIDETPADSHDSDTTKITATAANKYCSCTISASSIPAGSTIENVTVSYYGKKYGTGAVTVAAYCRSGITAYTGSTNTMTASYVKYSHDFTSSRAWTRDEVVAMQIGVKSVAADASNVAYVTQVYVSITYSSNHPKPTSLQCDRQTSPTQVSEFPVFTAIFNGNGSVVADSAYVVISMSPSFTSTSTMWVASSGWVNIPQVATATRCGYIYWDDTGAGRTGSWLRVDPLRTGATDGNYYWKIKFKTYADGIESLWSDTARFGADIIREWADTSCIFRRKLLFNTSHPQLTPSYTAKLTFKTGNRKILANDGAFNEAIQNSGGFQIATYQNKTHIVYLSKISTSRAYHNYGIQIVSIDNVTSEKGTPYYIDYDHANIPYDTHYFPTMCIDEDGYIHVFYGCHCNTVKYLRSKYPNQSGSLSDDSTANILWIDPNATDHDKSTPASIDGEKSWTGGSYPIGFNIPTDNRIYLVYRKGIYGDYGNNPFAYGFRYSTNNGTNWSSCYGIIYDTHSERYRVYLYGLRYDRLRSRLHIAWTYEHKNPYAERGVWYAYSDYGAVTSETLSSAGFNYWCWADGSTAGITRILYSTAPHDSGGIS